jgi:RNA polymerase sigma-70 factor (ECF subfamily)
MRGAGHVPNMTERDDARDTGVGEEEFKRLFDAHFLDLWRFARRRCACGADADDVTAEVFAIAWRRHDDLPAAEARLWLFGVARRVLANHRRSVDRNARLHSRLLCEAAPGWQEEHVAEADGRLRAALASLTEQDRELLLMHAWDALPVRDMATLLGCSANAVSLRLYKARLRLARELHRKESAAQGHVEADPFDTQRECHENS